MYNDNDVANTIYTYIHIYICMHYEKNANPYVHIKMLVLCTKIKNPIKPQKLNYDHKDSMLGLVRPDGHPGMLGLV